MITALIFCIPEAEPLVSAWRARHDPSAADGVPAHITVLAPFKPLEEIDAVCVSTLQHIMNDVAPLRLRFSAVGRFPDTVWLAPEPDEPIRQLTRTIERHFPEHPPYGGAFAEAIPHLTVAQGEPALLDAIAVELEGRIAEAIEAQVTECALFARTPAGWQEKRRFPLGVRS